MRSSDAFSADYVTARERFRNGIDRLGWTREAFAIGVEGPDGDALTIDIGYSTAGDPATTLVLSSGVHGVEGFFGSAVQVAQLDRWAATTAPGIRCVMLHGLNPYGFAWLRRFDEDNVDLNRNFLLAEESYAGAPAGYAGLDALLNPRCPPRPWDAFTLQAIGKIAQFGLPALRHAVAAGQYVFPLGLFYGGHGPTRSHQLLREHLARWLQASEQVVHLDFHTGLGRWGAWKLLIDHPLDASQRDRLERWFGAGSFDHGASSDIAYQASGGLGRWCHAQNLAPNYLHACAEFGTYRPIQVLAGLRAENQAHHWGDPSAESTLRAKQRLKELFVPAAEAWRTQAVEQSLGLIERTVQGLSERGRNIRSGARERKVQPK